jgi:hypothetical protein
MKFKTRLDEQLYLEGNLMPKHLFLTKTFKLRHQNMGAEQRMRLPHLHWISLPL